VRRLALVAVVGLAAAGCSHATKHVRHDPCASSRHSAAKQLKTSRALRGDVDGDGAPDRIALVRLRDNAPCGAVLVVRSGHRVYERAFPTVGDPRIPLLNGLAALRPGSLQIVVTTWEGASTAFARVFTIRLGRVSEIQTDTVDGTIPYEGSVTHFNAVDCVRGRPGTIVSSGWFERGASGRRFGFNRLFYRVGERSFEPAGRQSGRTRSPLPQRGRFPEFGEPQPFPSCMRVRAVS